MEATRQPVSNQKTSKPCRTARGTAINKHLITVINKTGGYGPSGSESERLIKFSTTGIITCFLYCTAAVKNAFMPPNHVLVYTTLLPFLAASPVPTEHHDDVSEMNRGQQGAYISSNVIRGYRNTCFFFFKFIFALINVF